MFSTFKSYRSHQNQYIKWCAEYNVDPIPVDPIAIQYYMATRANKVKVETVSKDLSAIRDLSISYGFDLNWNDYPQIKMMKKGLFNIYGKSEGDKRKPITFNILKQFYTQLDMNKFDDLMFFTWMVVMVTCMLRTSEGAAANKSVSPWGVNKASFSALWGRNLDIIRSDSDKSIVKYMILSLKGTKNAKFNQVVETVIGKGIDPINPVKLMLAYLFKRNQLSKSFSYLKFHENAPLFIWSDGSILTSADASLILNDLAYVCKLKGKFAGQSFRIGGGTSYAKRGYPDHVIQKAGRWKSDAFKTYIRLDNQFFADLPLQAMLQPIVQQYAQFGYNSVSKNNNSRVGGN